DVIFQALEERGVNTDDAEREGRLIFVESTRALSMFMVNGLPDAERFSKAVGDLLIPAVNSATEQGRRVAAFGGVEPLLWAQGNRSGAILIELLWDEIARTHGVHTLCGYVSAFRGNECLREFESVCRIHSLVYLR